MSGKSVPVYKIHPAIGIARLGNSPDEFRISPETPATLPLACDSRGNPKVSPDGETQQTVKHFKDAEGRVIRQAARFQIYVYDDESPEGRPLNLGNNVQGGGNHGKLVDIQWRVYLANKKASWYEFQQLAGEHGYASDHPLRNASITDPVQRQFLIIDPGPRVVDVQGNRRARFDRSGGGLYAPTFPPEKLHPRKIDTLGELLTDDSGRLLVLGGHGNSGTINTGLGQPRIDTYANNDGWFDDTSDGPVTARLILYSSEIDSTRYIDVEYPAWVIAAYPAYVPQVLDIITLDDVAYNTAVTEFAYRTDLFGTAGTFAQPQQIDPENLPALMHWQASNLMWNPDYKPWFYRDIWPILFRADEYTYLTNVLQQSNYPHNQTSRGNFDPTKLSIPPALNQASFAPAQASAIAANQSGQLFLEALEPVLLQIEQQADNTPHLKRKPLMAALVKRTDVRDQLREALADFANTIAGSATKGDPDGYILHWQQAYLTAQDPKAEGAADYNAASDKLHGVIRQVLFQLEVDLSGQPLLERRDTQDVPADGAKVQPDEPVQAAVERLYVSYRTGKLLAGKLAQLRRDHTSDPFATYRTYLYDLLRNEGEENVFRLEAKPTSRVHHLPLMPLLSGDNPISNELPSKFLRLTDYQLYLLRQWSRGLFYNEILEHWVPKAAIDPWQPYLGIQNHTGRQLDRNVLTNLAGGAFCPGAEVGWIIRNPGIYLKPYRLKADPDFYSFRQTAANENQTANAFPIPEEDYVSATGVALSLSSDYSVGLQPGDLTKMMGLPWQADFNECSTQDIDVTFEEWNQIDFTNPNDPWMKREQMVWETLWWPAHRPMQTFEVAPGTESNPTYIYLTWARGIPQTKAGDLKMVTEWDRLGFVIRNPYASAADLNQPSPSSPPPKYISIDRNQDS